MNCEILETLYVRANGDVPCNDDAGEAVLLGRVDASADASIQDLLSNERYAHIRTALASGRAPWSSCQTCAWLRPNQPFHDAIATRRIRKIQVEPSLSCNLRCPCCSNQLQVAQRPRPVQMDIGLFDRLLGSLVEHGFEVDEIEYCGQGEPVLHRAFHEFVGTARSRYPNALQRLITNGNADYGRALAGQLVDEVFVSCDGARQASYERYRIHGRLDRAVRFMADARAASPDHAQKVIWKYILFEFNDSDDELLEAQAMAQQLDVDTLLFVITHSRYRSTRWTPTNIALLPRRYPFVLTNATPIHGTSEHTLAAREPLEASRGIQGHIDLVRVTDTELQVSGWVRANGGARLDALQVVWDADASVTVAAQPRSSGGNARQHVFHAVVPLPGDGARPGRHVIEIRARTSRLRRRWSRLRQPVEVVGPA